MNKAPIFRNAQDAFKDAIAQGRLSSDPKSPIYAGLFMYMGTAGAVDMFKNSDTREYLK